MSVGLGVFNLVPVHPLDGSRVVDAFMPFSWSLKLQKYQNIIFFVFIAALWFGWLDGIMGTGSCNGVRNAGGKLRQPVSVEAMDFHLDRL